MYGQQQQMQQQPIFVQSPYPPQQYVTSTGLVQSAPPPQPQYVLANQQPMAPMYAPTMVPYGYSTQQTPVLPVVPEHQRPAGEPDEKYTNNFSFCANIFLGLLTILFGICAIGGGILEVITWPIYFKYQKLGSSAVDDLIRLLNETNQHYQDSYDNYSYYVGFWSGIMIIAGGSVIVSSRRHSYGVLQSAIGAIFGMIFAIVQLILSGLPLTQTIVNSDFIKGVPMLYAAYIVLIVSAAATILSTFIICITCLVAFVDGICCQSSPQDVRSSSSRASRVVPMYDANVAQPGYISPASTYFPYPPPPTQSYAMGPTVLQVAPYSQPPPPVFSPTQPTQPQSIPPTPAPVQAQAQYQSQSQSRLAMASPSTNANANAAPTAAGPTKTPAPVPAPVTTPIQVKPAADANAKTPAPVKISSIEASTASLSAAEIIPETPTASVHGTRPVPPSRPTATSGSRAPGPPTRTPVPSRAPATQVRITTAPAARPASTLPMKSPGESETNVIVDSPAVASPVPVDKE